MGVKKLEAFWSPAFDDMEDLIFLIDSQFTIIRANRSMANLMAREPDEVAGKRCYELVHCREMPIMGCPHKKALDSRAFEAEEIYEDGLKKWLSVRVTPICGDGGELLGSIHIATDITKRKEAERLLEEKIHQLQHLNEVLITREERVLEIKHEVNALLRELGRPPKYEITIE